MEGGGRTERKREGVRVRALEGVGGINTCEVGITNSESVVNALAEGEGIAAFTEEPDFSWGVGECSVNNEPVEISWEIDTG